MKKLFYFHLHPAVQKCVLIKEAFKKAFFFFLVSVIGTEHRYSIDGINILNDCRFCGRSSLPV